MRITFLNTGNEKGDLTGLRKDGRMNAWREAWWATKDLNLGPLPCEGNALTN
jgi:hypothetical protein